MSFFDPVPAPQSRPKPQRRQPWAAPPDNELGASVPIRLLLAETDDLALAITDVVAYSTGFVLRVIVKPHFDATSFDPRELMGQLHGFARGETNDQLRLGIEFSDGRKATNLGPRTPPAPEPPEISMRSSGGGGGSGQGWSIGYWIYPLPPPGPITIACAWPHIDLDERTLTTEAGPILDAAGEAIELWPDRRPFAPAGDPPAAFTGGEQTVLERP